jgi:hypothetical protein
MGVALTLLWSNRALSMKSLRLVELTVFELKATSRGLSAATGLLKDRMINNLTLGE